MSLIYIIEDNPNYSHALQVKLHLEGHQCHLDHGQHSPEETIRDIKRVNPKLIIIDSTLPHASLSEYLTKIRSDDDIARKHIFLLADTGAKGKKRETATWDVDLVLYKQGANVDELVDKIKKVIKNKKI